MVDLTHVARLIAGDHGLAVVAVARADGSVSSSVVNAGLVAHPVNGAQALGFVMRADTFKRRRLIADPRVTVTVRSGWEWQAVEGSAELIGPLDPCPSGYVDVPGLLRAVFQAAGGTHDDWPTYDHVMATEQRTAVLVTPSRVYGNVGV
jgi:hypothetical protein